MVGRKGARPGLKAECSWARGWPCSLVFQTVGCYHLYRSHKQILMVWKLQPLQTFVIFFHMTLKHFSG